MAGTWVVPAVEDRALPTGPARAPPPPLTATSARCSASRPPPPTPAAQPAPPRGRPRPRPRQPQVPAQAPPRRRGPSGDAARRGQQRPGAGPSARPQSFGKWHAGAGPAGGAAAVAAWARGWGTGWGPGGGGDPAPQAALARRGRAGSLEPGRRRAEEGATRDTAELRPGLRVRGAPGRGGQRAARGTAAGGPLAPPEPRPWAAAAAGRGAGVHGAGARRGLGSARGGRCEAGRGEAPPGDEGLRPLATQR